MYSAPEHISTLASPLDNQLLSIIHQAYGESTTAFSLNVLITKLEVNWLAEFEEAGGLLYSYAVDGNKHLLFDASKHGYNGRFEISEPESSSTFTELALSAGKSGSVLILAFQYAGDEQAYASENKDDAPEEYFDWFVLYELIDGKLNELYEYECA